MKSGKERSVQQEKRLARRNAGAVQPGSGSGDHRKGDVTTARFLMEAKCRTDPNAKQITIKLVDLRKNEQEAMISSKLGVLSFELGGEDWMIVSQNTWEEIVNDDTR